MVVLPGMHLFDPDIIMTATEPHKEECARNAGGWKGQIDGTTNQEGINILAQIVDNFQLELMFGRPPIHTVHSYA